VWPEALAVDRFLARARMRLVLLRAIEGGIAGAVLGALVSLFGGGVSVVVLTLVLAVSVRIAFGDAWRWGWWRSPSALARQVERRTARGRNLLVTAAELPRDDRSYVNNAVMQRAAEISAGLRNTELFPVRRAITLLGLAVIALLTSRVRRVDISAVVERGLNSTSGPSIRSVVVTVTPPPYAGLPQATLTNPSRIEALASSRIAVRVEAVGSAVRMETLAGSQELTRSAGSFNGSVVATNDGFVAVEARDSTGAKSARSLIGLAVTADRSPRVSLTSPGRDLFFSTVPGSLPVVITADDDLELSSLQLRYTAVSGSGERFTFVERDVPITVTRANPRTWTARGTWNLVPLGLAPGDLVVYRAIASDRRPGAAPVESESYVIEVVTPGAIAAEGFAADDHRDRYAASQQMVILKTERLLARRGSMAADSVTDEARLLSAEQRQVRAEFVFMMGGEVEDLAADAAGSLDLNEVAEAEAEGDLLAGRQRNQGRVEMMRAIRAMSRASAALTDASLEQALRDERSALDNLMRAFSRSRFILRALTQRERIDLERRLSGSLNLTAGLSGPAAEPVADPRVASLRRLLAEVAALSASDSSKTRVSDAALAVVRADPGSELVRRLVDRVQAATRATRVPPAAIDSLLRQISGLVERLLPQSPNVNAAVEVSMLEGILRDATRRRAPR
jgi:hypothetical protein